MLLKNNEVGTILGNHKIKICKKLKEEVTIVKVKVGEKDIMLKGSSVHTAIN